jgi:hypothetical protein
MVIPISQASRAYADEVRKTIRRAHFFVDGDHGDNKMEKKIRDAQMEQYNYILVRPPGGVSLWLFEIGREKMMNFTVCAEPGVTHKTVPLSSIFLQH